MNFNLLIFTHCNRQISIPPQQQRNRAYFGRSTRALVWPLYARDHDLFKTDAAHPLPPPLDPDAWWRRQRDDNAGKKTHNTYTVSPIPKLRETESERVDNKERRDDNASPSYTIHTDKKKIAQTYVSQPAKPICIFTTGGVSETHLPRESEREKKTKVRELCGFWVKFVKSHTHLPPTPLMHTFHRTLTNRTPDQVFQCWCVYVCVNESILTLTIVYVGICLGIKQFEGLFNPV